MVKLPELPFKVSGVGDEHPFVVEALKPRKPFERCWCGSGKKFRKCHRFRAQEEALTLGQLLAQQEHVFWRNRGCMHPSASNAVCRGRVIDAHTIQRMGPLQKITDVNNHVYHLEPSQGGGFSVEAIGWRRASTFPGYCAEHDSQVFGTLERGIFTGSHEQCVLQAYRSVCNELYKKRALIESLEYQRNLIDRGCSLDEQISKQLSYAQNIAGQSKSRQELEWLWRKFQDAVTKREYDRFRSKCYFFKGTLDVTSSGTLATEFDFHGKKLMDMWDLNVDAQMLSHSIMATDDGGAIVLTWLTEQEMPQSVVTSYDHVPDEDKGDIFAQYCFLNCENTYFSKTWWDALDQPRQDQLKKYAAVTFYEGGAFRANHDKLVNWRFAT